MTDGADIAGLTAMALERYGRIGGLVNNAGVSLHGPLDQVGLEEFRRVLDLNVIGVIQAAVNMLALVARRELADAGSSVSPWRGAH